jgi:hypothetical protein
MKTKPAISTTAIAVLRRLAKCDPSIGEPLENDTRVVMGPCIAEWHVESLAASGMPRRYRVTESGRKFLKSKEGK